MLSFGIDCAFAALTAARRRGLKSGSGMPIRAATVISRLSFENRFERFLSCAPLRYMMFLYLEWPAMAVAWSCGLNGWAPLHRAVRSEQPLPPSPRGEKKGRGAHGPARQGAHKTTP